jgi:hypothetical protein
LRKIPDTFLHFANINGGGVADIADLLIIHKNIGQTLP